MNPDGSELKIWRPDDPGLFIFTLVDDPMADENERYICAVIQLTSTEEHEQNVKEADFWIREAAHAGARLVCLPENFSFFRTGRDTPIPLTTMDGPLVKAMGKLAQELDIYLLLGSIPEVSPVIGKMFNTSVLIDRNGEVVASYRKLHLFDLEVPGQETIKESTYTEAGDCLVAVRTALGTFGLTVCYDLRFPELYRALVFSGANLLTVPSAFTMYTGKDHWIPLLRSRAIENFCYVVAPNQYGKHGSSMRTFGRSAIIDPWGNPIAIASDGKGFAMGVIDLGLINRVRDQMPCLEHRHRLFYAMPTASPISK